MCIMVVKKFIFNWIISPIITFIMGILLTSIYSQIKTGTWTNLFYLTSPVYYYIFILFIIIQILLIIIFKNRKQPNETFGNIGSVSHYGYENISDYPYADVLWKIQVPKKHPLVENAIQTLKSNPLYDKSYDIFPLEINIENIPRCPECGTELEISDGSMWNTWSCFNCGFKKRTKQDVNKTHERVKKIVDREIEKVKEANLENNEFYNK